VFGAPTTADATPTFTWAATHAERGATQTSFVLMVTDAATSAVAHDSRLISSADPHYTLPAPLPAGRSYEWTVVWYDAKGNASPASEPAAFRTAIAPPAWEGVPWLGSNTTNVYRTEVSLTADAHENLAAATLYVCALGYGKFTRGCL